MDTLTATSDDGKHLRLVRWTPDGWAAGAGRDALLLHGLAEHAGRYGHVAAALVAAGWRATFVELHGHGKSEGQRGHVSRWRRYVEDVQAAAAVVGGPFVMVCHSMGGLVGLCALMEPLTPRVRAIAISNPLLGVRVQAPPVKLKAAGVLSKLLPWLPLANEIDTSKLSRDPEVVRRYESDPLVYTRITPRWFTEMNAAREAVLAYAGQFTHPLHLMIGDADGICDPDAARAFGERWGGPRSVKVYPGLYHELFNEPEKETVLAELIAWMDGLAD